MKDMGKVSRYLGISVKQDLKKGVTVINQTEYLKSVLEKFGMSDCKPLSLPIDKNFKFDVLKKKPIREQRSTDEMQKTHRLSYVRCNGHETGHMCSCYYVKQVSGLCE